MPAEHVQVTTPDGVARAYLSRPDDDAPRPGVLLLMDAFGLRPRIEEMADRVAAAGYVVLAPDTFYRAADRPPLDLDALADPDRRGELLGQVMPLIGQLTPAVAVTDGGAYLDHLQRVAPGRVGVTGYCMGGRFGWRIAAAYPDRVAALGVFHAGGMVTDDPESPHRAAGRLRCAVYVGHADHDQSNTPAQIAALEDALAGAGVPYRSELYADALHGYTMADTPVYDEAASERHFRELLALLERALPA